MSEETKYIRNLTYSGDFYSATEELWKKYWSCVHSNDWDSVMDLETGKEKDFFYDP